MYTQAEFFEDVKKEAAALRVHATKEELGKLTMDELDPSCIDTCIYGLMTGSCHTSRAIELIGSCAHRYVKDINLTEIRQQGFERIRDRVNGKTVKDLNLIRQSEFVTHYSAIEAYILLPEAKNANLIAYLKGESETLEL